MASQTDTICLWYTYVLLVSKGLKVLSSIYTKLLLTLLKCDYLGSFHLLTF